MNSDRYFLLQSLPADQGVSVCLTSVKVLCVKMFLPLQTLLILSIVTKINGHKDDIEAIIYMDRIHPTPTSSVKKNFDVHIVKVKKMVQRGTAIAIAMMEQYADFMRDQECQSICQGRFVLYKRSTTTEKKISIPDVMRKQFYLYF